MTPSKIYGIPPDTKTAAGMVEVEFVACDEGNVDEIIAAVDAGEMHDMGLDDRGVHWFKRRFPLIEADDEN